MVSLVTLTFSQPSRTLSPGEILVNEGDHGGDLYILESGSLVVERQGVAITRLTEPGALVGEMSVLLKTRNTATVRADKPTTVRVVKDALAFLERSPLVALHVATVACARLNTTSALLVELKQGAKEDPKEQKLLNRIFSSLVGA